MLVFIFMSENLPILFESLQNVRHKTDAAASTELIAQVYISSKFLSMIIGYEEAKGQILGYSYRYFQAKHKSTYFYQILLGEWLLTHNQCNMLFIRYNLFSTINL